jgi:nucleoside-diphosphate-sugar epimerase
LQLATLINAYTGNQTPLDLRPARDWDRSGKRFASTDKSTRELGFTASVEIDEGIRRTVEWTRANMQLIQGNISKHSKLMAQASS